MGGKRDSASSGRGGVRREGDVKGVQNDGVQTGMSSFHFSLTPSLHLKDEFFLDFFFTQKQRLQISGLWAIWGYDRCHAVCSFSESQPPSRGK